jgi:hypothetical protein
VEKKQIRPEDSITVEPDGRIAIVKSLRKEKGVQYAFVRMQDTNAMLKVPLKLCARAHIAPEVKPIERRYEYCFRVVNKATGEVVRQGEWRPTRAQALRDRESRKYIFNRSVRMQIIERTERVCEEKDGEFAPERYL